MKILTVLPIDGQSAGEKLKELRESLNMSQQQVTFNMFSDANVLGVDQYERDLDNVIYYYLARMVNALGCQLAIVREDDDPVQELEGIAGGEIKENDRVYIRETDDPQVKTVYKVLHVSLGKAIIAPFKQGFYYTMVKPLEHLIRIEE